MHLLGEYRENIVLIGGWVPDILLSKEGESHVGSIDVDLALNHKKLKDEGYRTIRELLLNRGYKEGDQPFAFERTVDVSGNEVVVEVDFLAGEYEGTSIRRLKCKVCARVKCGDAISSLKIQKKRLLKGSCPVVTRIPSKSGWPQLYHFSP